MTKGIVIAGFAGIGKSTLSEKYENIINLDSVFFKFKNVDGLSEEEIKNIEIKEEIPNWEANYMEEILKKRNQYDIVLVPSQPRLLPWYEKYEIEYILCYPHKDYINEYFKRYEERGNNEYFINKMRNGYQEEYEIWKQKEVLKFILEENEYLEDYLLKNNYELKKR